ncbi:MAG: hypothetical protein N3F09_09640 [Bacteroidia bacterium]|nr:hypothetical protein [Bacteroidia bacterium]
MNIFTPKMRYVYVYLGGMIPTPRHRFVFNFFFNIPGKLSHSYITEITDCQVKDAVIINYSQKTVPGSFHVYPFGLLEENNIRANYPEVKAHPDYLKIFFLNSGQADLPFDIFSASFWLLSRYEEYLEVASNVSGDFSHRSSLAWQNEFLDIPLIDHWRKMLFEKAGIGVWANDNKIPVRFPVDMELSSKTFRRIVNQTLWKVNLQKPRQILNSLFGKRLRAEEEEIIHFRFFHELVRYENRVKFLFFWNTANEADNPLSLLSKFTSIHVPAKRLNDYAEPGLLLRGKEDTPAREDEISKFILRLKNILHSEILNVRSNKGLFVNSQIQKKLSINGLKHDYSGLYYHTFGYRYSTLYPFPCFDLTSNRISDFILHPVAVCDTYLFESGKDEFWISKLKKDVQLYGGECNILLNQRHYSDDLTGKKKKEKLLHWIHILTEENKTT